MKEPERLLSGIDIYFSNSIQAQDISVALKRTFSNFEFFFWDFSSGKSPPEAYTAQNHAHVLFRIETLENHSEFPFLICIDAPMRPMPYISILKLCQELSIDFKMKCLCEYLNSDDPTNPYYSVLFDQGSGFLVDDSKWEDQKQLKILRTFEIAQLCSEEIHLWKK